ncbi:retinitis pigmentosa 1-like 1 protein [Echeneis naucrates]|uniref:retinitis pigmentosa 1-like 1 protein n=1 Tax=Echeneis naucrates TaxID=173247 RepID=UPI001113962D|nr:retinitis pigmentosa 1-like 1 protein [Echeneis naucrates]
MWDPRLQSKHASSLPHPPLSNLRPTRVTTATPAKRITFYKSGDSQFGGIRMAIHKRSFKCFDALLDDLSQKVPLPFGVRTVTTPRGTNTIRHLEQLQDGGCYLCSDRRHTKPINIELASKRPSIWYHHSRRPHRPETSSPPSHVLYRQRRILLIKNTEPGMRRSIVLNRRSTRSLRAFLDEVSEVMQFHVRKLYTAEGRRIDNVQSLLTCPGVLVCAGREAFSPMLVNFIKKSSEEKLPGLGPRTPGNGARSPATQTTRSPPHGAQSRASEYSEGHESKKNVNFGLETKKSIIHPRSDSSNRSTRFSLSSEKSYGNGVSAYSQGRPAIMNDDIEKRVLVNKDGSLSVEMRVRFRLQNDETVQWSTQVKKSPSLTTDCSPLSQVQAHYLQQGQSESCSDPDYVSFEPEGMDYSRQPLERALEVSQCPCCYQRPERQYDLWENPAHSHKQPIAPPPHPHKSSRTTTLVRHTHSSSSSSSCNSRRVVRCRAQLSGCGRGSGSEHGQLVQEQMCVTEQVERRVEVERDGDTHVEVCRVSRCCSRSEVVAIDTNLRPLSGRSAEEELMAEEERPLSAVSSSSRVLQSLKEDQDDEDHDLPPSASQCCHSKEPSPSPAFQTQLMDNPSSNISAGFVDSVGERGSRALSAASSCHCGTVTPYSKAEAEELDQVPISRSRMRRTSCRSNKTKTPDSEEEGAADDEDEEINRVVSSLSGHTGFSVCPNCGGCKRTASERSHCSHQDSSKPASPLQPDKSTQGSNDDGSDDSAMSTQSNKTNLTNNGRFSAISNVLEERPSSTVSRTSNSEQEAKEEERAPSATSTTSHRSNISHKSGCNCATDVTADKEEERSPTAMSAQSNFSSKSRKSRHNPEGPSHRKPQLQLPTVLNLLCNSCSLAWMLEALAPHSRQSKPSKTSGKMSEKNANSQNDQEDELEPTPACLPNASPNEVVSDWLRSIPANSSMLALGDELMDYEQEKEVEEKAGEEVAKEEEVDERLGHEDKTEAEDNVDKDGEAECDAAEKSPDPTPGNAVGLCSRPNPLFSNSESLPRNWHSSVAVMKVLLTSSLGRCRSMPEVSPVYGRRLSTSARGLLDCLAQLQLIEPAVSPGFEQQKDRNQQYEDIMAILQSLWLTEPRDFEATKIKDNGIQQVTPPRSSSGVDMSSGSGGSGKENGNQGRHESLQKKTEYSHDDEEAVKVVGENVERNVEEGEKENEAEPQDLHIEQAVTDTADEQDQSTILPSLDSPKASDNPSSSDKSSANDSSKSPTDNEQETVEDSSSGTPPTILRASFSKKLSQDPDPVWVLNLLKKLEKQFINHYINAMAEFKVRWELDDSLILDTMISELRDEVSRRIQSSIEREMRKIQGRAGRGGRSPRPPQGMNLSRDSTMTEKRRQLLKVMKNQSVKTADSLSDGELTGEFSDQRSDDEYCPCDTCVRKKMAARPLKANPIAAEAPVMMEFDLLKILQLKKNPLPTPAAVTQSKEEKIEMVVVDEEGRNLEVVHEEEEEDETKEDIKAQIVLEETIPEEDEEDIEEDADEYGEEREAGEQRTSDEENEAASVNGEEEEEESECQCQCARNEDSDSSNEGEEAEETSDYTGEDEKGDDKSETGSGKEESDRETVKEATAGEEETTENEEEEGGCEVCDFKPEEVADSESGENEETNDDNAAENAVNQESTLVEEFADGNISASAEAENEDDTDDGAGEGESHESHEDEKGGESEQQEGLSSEEERDSPPDQEVTPAAEGEEADAEDSDISNKRPSDNSAEESGHERPGSAGGEEGGDDKEDRVVEDAVEELKPDEEDEVVNSKKKEVDVLLHQFTKTSVESQPGSLEEVNMSSHLNPVSTIEGSKTVVSTGGGATQRRSRSPARVKRCKPKEKDIELDNL